MYGNGVERTLGKILATQERILHQLEQHNKRLETHMEEDRKLQNRVDNIEKRMSWIAGVAAGFVLIISFVSDLFLTKIGLK